MERIDPVKRRGGLDPVRLPVLSPLDREREREERERRRRAAVRRPAGPPASQQPGGVKTDGDDAMPRLDVSA